MSDNDESPDEDELPDLEDPSMSRDVISVLQFWKQFTVKDCVDNLVKAWDSITPATILHGWRKLTPHLYPRDAEPAQDLSLSLAETLAAAREVPGLSDLSEEDVAELQAVPDDKSQTENIMDIAALEDHLQKEL